jgi:hypothetical protein
VHLRKALRVCEREQNEEGPEISPFCAANFAYQFHARAILVAGNKTPKAE